MNEREDAYYYDLEKDHTDEDRDPFEQQAREETERFLWEHATPEEREEYEKWSKDLDEERRMESAEAAYDYEREEKLLRGEK